MGRIIRKINEYFFPIEEDEEITTSDGLWFYGIIAIMIIVAAGTITAI